MQTHAARTGRRRSVRCNPPTQVLGRNCRFLQGHDTDPRDVESIRAIIRSGGEGVVRILN